MFRIVPDEMMNPKTLRCLQEETSQTILGAFNYLFKNEETFYEFYYSVYEPEFFKGMGEYFKCSDLEFGVEWMKRKIDSMKKKLQDPAQAYTFDVFEENVFWKVIKVINSDRKSGRKEKPCTIHRNHEETFARMLITQCGEKEDMAKQYARKVCRCWDMALKDGEDDNLFFWDDDYLFFYVDGFKAGLMFLKGIAGESAGYGYEYVVHMFEEIGMKAPILLLGTKEANRIANEIAMEKIKNQQKEEWKEWSGESDTKWHDLDGDLPFN